MPMTRIGPVFVALRTIARWIAGAARAVRGCPVARSRTRARLPIAPVPGEGTVA
jgi:hypothetical protein